MNRLLTIPLTQLRRAADNVRKTRINADIASLAASIEAHGLLQNLTVRRLPANGSDKRNYEVVAGGRRLQALKLLAKRRKLERDFGVPCRLVDEDQATALEVSLAENVVRVSLHPADQFDAFSRLQEQGLSSAEIGARFGAPQRLVEQRLKLAAVSPKLMAEYRENRIILDQLTAFAVCDDHEAQERVWFEEGQRNRQSIRRALTRSLVDGSDRRARFVGAEAYEQAGGAITRDLFEEKAAYFADSQLLDRLVADKLRTEAETIRLEGWSFVEVQVELDHELLARFGKLFPQMIELTPKDAKRLKVMSERYDTLVSQLEEEASDEQVALLDKLSAEIEELSRRREHWSKKKLKEAGALISLTSDGTLQVTRGLVRQEVNNKKARREADVPSAEQTPRSDYSDALLRELSAHWTAGLRETVAGQPELALSALIHALALRTLFGSCDATCIDIRPVALDLGSVGDGLAESPAVLAMANRHKRWAQQLSGPETVWPWLGEQTMETRLELLAFLIASTINAVDTRRQAEPIGRLNHAEILAKAAQLDMTRWWRPTARDYFNRVSKEKIVEAVAQQQGQNAAENISRMKKQSMAIRAEQLLVGSGWLPELFRKPSLSPSTSLSQKDQ